MTGSQDSLSDNALSDTLSARSYFGLAQETRAADIDLKARVTTPDSMQEPHSKSLIVADSPARDRRPRTRKSSQMHSGLPGSPEIKDPHPGDRPVRKRGRPRLETAKDAAAIEERRLQIRRAQRTYRQKKEATIQALKTRVGVLEQTLQNVSELLGPDDNDVDSLRIDAQSDHLTRARRLVLAEIKKPQSLPVRKDQGLPRNTDTLRDVFGYQVSHSRARDEDTDSKYNPNGYRTQPHARSPSPLLNRLFPSTAIYTYSYQECNLSRRLQRFCVEHTYRWLTDPTTDPGHMSRVFGLLPCIHDMPGVRRAFRRILQSEIGSPLESDKLPFYTLGGASTHYPRLDPDGFAVNSGNVRRPGRILRRMTHIQRRGGIQDWNEDWSGDVDPDVDDDQTSGEKTMSEEDRLIALDLDGEWFDCHDVQGYLEHRGVVFNGSSLWLDVASATVVDLHSLTPGASSSYLHPSLGSAFPLSQIESWCHSLSGYVLDVECFFDLLLPNLRVLGRAPGFRSRDVDAALRSAIHRRPSS